MAHPLDDAKAKPQQLLQTRGSARESALVSRRRAARLCQRSRRPQLYRCLLRRLRRGHLSRPLHRSRQQSRLVARLRAHRFSAHPAGQGCTALRAPSHCSSLVHSRGRTWPPARRTKSGARPKEPGSAYRETDSQDQLHWTVGDRIVFPWERDGWLHLYAVPASGGTATLLTPGATSKSSMCLSAPTARRWSSTPIKTTSTGATSGESHFAADGSEASRGSRHLRRRHRDPARGRERRRPSPCCAPMSACPFAPPSSPSGNLVDLAPQAIPADFPGANS